MFRCLCDDRSIAQAAQFDISSTTQCADAIVSIFTSEREIFSENRIQSVNGSQ